MSRRTVRASVLILTLALLSNAASLLAQPAEKRVALVIGNGAYEHLPKLANPANDARDISEALSSLGFEVISRIDADRASMEEAVFDFAVRLESGNAVGMFYYAGHGVQSRGSNYLLPVDADIDSEAELRIRAVEADLILEYMHDAGNPLNVIVLDACRDNPFEGSFRSANRGLARVEELPKGSIVVYATQPGNVAEDGRGENGTFTGALLEHITIPGLDVMEMFRKVGESVSVATNDRQRPWINTDFYGSFSFTGALSDGERGPKPPDLVQDEPAQAQVGELYLITDPPGAVVRIDGVEQGKSPLLLTDQPLGRDLTVSARLENMSAEKTVRLTEDFTQLSLELAVETGRLLIIPTRTDATESVVFLDGERQGELGTGLFDGVPTGEYRVEIEGDGIYFEGSANVEANSTAQIRPEFIEVGTLHYELPLGAQVLITAQGYSRVVRGSGSVEHLPVGSYTVEASGSGYIPESEEVTIGRGRTASFKPFTTGVLEITSDPSGSRVEIDGRYRGTTPLTVELPAGRVEVEVSRNGYETGTRTVMVAGGRRTEREVELEIESGTLRYELPSGAQARITGDGYLRVVRGTGSLDHLPVGTYSVTASGSGLLTETEEITIARNRTTSFEPFATGALQVTSQPSGASVEIDGNDFGKTPATFEIPAGRTVEIVVSKDRYETSSRSVEVVGGTRNEWSVILDEWKPPLPDFVVVEAGTFTMGSPRDERGRDDDERQHQVTISQDFIMATTEVTHAQFITFLNDVEVSPDGSYQGTKLILIDSPVSNCAVDYVNGRFVFGGSSVASSPETPIVEVTWYGAVEYCNWLSRKDNRTSVYELNGSSVRWNRQADGYRLPTEAEWEFAARGGSQSRGTVYSGSNEPWTVAWYTTYTGDRKEETHPVGLKQPNELGLFDMSGNVAEWCWDWYGAYPRRRETDPTGPSSGADRVVRGGRFNFGHQSLRCAARYDGNPTIGDDGVGFRIAASRSGE